MARWCIIFHDCFFCCIAHYGIAAVVALDSLNNSLQDDIDRNAKSFWDADYVINTNHKFELNCSGCVRFQRKLNRLRRSIWLRWLFWIKPVATDQARCVWGPFPFYGELETQPADAYQKWKAAAMQCSMHHWPVSVRSQLRRFDPHGNVVFKVVGEANVRAEAVYR